MLLIDYGRARPRLGSLLVLTVVLGIVTGATLALWVLVWAL